MNNGRNMPPYGGDQNGQYDDRNRQNSGYRPTAGQYPYNNNNNYQQGQNYPQNGGVQRPYGGQYPPYQNGMPQRPPQGQMKTQGQRPPQGQRPTQGPRPPQGQRPPQRSGSGKPPQGRSNGLRKRRFRKPTPFLVLILVFVLLLIIIIATSRSCRKDGDSDGTGTNSGTNTGTQSVPVGGTDALDPQTTGSQPSDTQDAPATPSDDMLYTIFIDPGHGFNDPGASSQYLTDGLTEKDMTLEFAKELVQILNDRGYYAKLTHDGQTVPKSSIDDNDDLFYIDERAAYVNENSVDLFVSIHCDSYDSESVNGTRVYYCNEDNEGIFSSSAESEKLTNYLVSFINEKFPSAKAARAYGNPFADAYYVTKHINAPAALVELGFITNPDDAKSILDSGWRTKMAEAIADGICKFADENSPYASQQPSTDD